MHNFAYLSDDPVVFEPISSTNSVFFDPTNNQVFTLRARGAMGVNVKTLGTKNTINFRIQDRGEVLSIKFDPTFATLSLQRKQNSVDFINFENGRPDNVEYNQLCQKSTHRILGFVWTRETEILYITEGGFELYEVIREKLELRLLKQGTVPTNWYTWDSLNKVIILSSGKLANKLHIMSFKKPGCVLKLVGFKVDSEEILPSNSSSGHSFPDFHMLQQKNCLLANIYAQLYACILSRSINGGVELSLYQLILTPTINPTPIYKTHVLVVPEQGKIAVNFVNNLILVHHQHSKTTLLYDIAIQGEYLDNTNAVETHYPILPPISLADVNISCKSIPSLSLQHDSEFKIPLYASTWIVFPPNVVIDGSLGCLWTVCLNLDAFTKLIENPVVIIECLTNRTDGKPVLLSFISQLIEQITDQLLLKFKQQPQQPVGFRIDSFSMKMEIFSHLFDRLARIQQTALKAKLLSKSSACKSPTASTTEYLPPFVCNFQDVNKSVFSSLALSKEKNVQSFLSQLIIDYIKALKFYSVPIDDLLYELLLECLVKAEDYDGIVYCINSDVIVASKQIAFQLLATESSFPLAGQLAFSVLQKLGTGEEEIFEILLSKNDPIAALRFCCESVELFKLPDTSRKILDASKQSSNPTIFYSVFRFFEQMDSIANFSDVKFQPYVSHFISLYGSNSLASKK